MSNERVYVIEGVDCAVCAARIEKAVNTIEGVGSSQIDLLHNRLRIHTTQHNTDLDTQIAQVVAKEEHGTKVYTDAEEPTLSTVSNSVKTSFFKTYLVPIRITIAILFTIMASTLSGSYMPLLIFMLAYAISGYEIVLKALRNLFRGNMFDENFLMTLATIGAFIIGEYAEAVAVMAFYQVGEFFQDLAVNRSRKSIADLMDIKPVSATVIKNNEIINVKPQEILVGDTILIRAGEKIPVDCQVISGNAQIDVSALTGESLPCDVQYGDKLLSGSVNIDGLLHAEATSLYKDSTVATILKLVEDSSQKKAQTERFITKFARYYTPIVVFLALFIAFIPPLAGMGELSTWVYRALVFLVVSCPCALVISVPIGFFGGIGGLAKMGILVKGGNYIQALARTKYVVFDKTGTITKGTFSVTAVHNFKQEYYSSHEIIAFAAAVEMNSNHPIAKAIVAHNTTDSLLQSTEVKEISGKGMHGLVDGRKVEVGTRSFLTSLQYEVPLSEMDTIGPSVFVAIDEQVVAQIILSDTIKQESHEAIRTLQSMGITNISMLSGDTQNHVEKTASAVGITTFAGELLPQQKIDQVEAMMVHKNLKDTLLFVGDGINDAPVLARSDIGVSMGSMGSDAAVEASDMVIMGDNLLRIPQGIAHAKKTVTIVTQNIVFALGIKAIVMALGAFGIATMWLAVFADTGVALLAVLNSLRALKHE